MRRGTWALLGLIILLAVGAWYIDVNPGNRGINIPFLGYSNDLSVKQGLDLQGGIQFLLKASCPTDQPTCAIGSELQPTIDNITQRVSKGLGVNEAVVTYQQDPQSGNYYISVELPGLKSDTEALSLIGTTGNLVFIDTGGNYIAPGTTVDLTQYKGKTPFTGRDLDSNAINVSFDTTGKPQIDFQMQGNAKNTFADYTQQNIGKYLTVVLDGKVIESAVIQSQITGQGEITGSMTLDQAQTTASLLRYGALPLPLNLVSERQIAATLGAQAIKYSERAALIGLGLVIFFMLFYYRLPGLIATLALGLYAGLVFAVIKLLGAVLTLAGIAGLILSIGMAVDANILIFERMKEELRSGRTLADSIKHGWERAWTSIRDSNASTIITCLILWYVGNNFSATVIVGFAVNLLIGVAVSLFTAVVVTRSLLNLVLVISRGSLPGWLIGLPQGLAMATTYRRRPVTTRRETPAVALASGGSSDEDQTEDEGA